MVPSVTHSPWRTVATATQTFRNHSSMRPSPRSEIAAVGEFGRPVSHGRVCRDCRIGPQSTGLARKIRPTTPNYQSTAAVATQGTRNQSLRVSTCFAGNSASRFQNLIALRVDRAAAGPLLLGISRCSAARRRCGGVRHNDVSGRPLVRPQRRREPARAFRRRANLQSATRQPGQPESVGRPVRSARLCRVPHSRRRPSSPTGSPRPTRRSRTRRAAGRPQSATA